MASRRLHRKRLVAHSSSVSFIQCIIHSVFRSFIPSFMHAFIYSLMHSLIHSFIYSFIRSFVRSLTHSLIHSIIHSFIHSFIHFIHSFFHFIPFHSIPFIHSFGHSRIDSLVIDFMSLHWHLNHQLLVVAAPSLPRRSHYLVSYISLYPNQFPHLWLVI